MQPGTTGDGRRRLGRRRLLELTGTGLAASLGGCNALSDHWAPTFDGPVSLLTRAFSADDERMRSWLSAAESGHGTEWTDLPSDADVRGHLDGDSPPHVLGLQSDASGALSADGALAGFADRIPADHRDSYDVAVLDHHSSADALYGLPFFQTTTVSFGRTAWLSNAGVDDVPSSTSELLDLAKRIAVETDASYGLTFPTAHYSFWSLWASEGIDLLTEDGGAPAFDTERAVDILYRLQYLTGKDVVPKSAWRRGEAAAARRFGSGDTGIVVTWASSLPTLEYYGSWLDDSSVAVSPLSRGTYRSFQWNLVGDHEGPAAAAGASLVASLQGDDVQADIATNFPVFAGRASVNRALRESADYEPFRADNPIRQRLLEVWADAKADTVAPPRHPKAVAIWEAIREEFVAGGLGAKAADVAVADAADRVTELL